ncbi:hypothetical protein CLCAR_0355 [Clostridium carboxidivorans P7]|nr:hypothetical protein CLCAR_0355 [Clostridium carboxidivorans P7]
MLRTDSATVNVFTHPALLFMCIIVCHNAIADVDNWFISSQS